MMEIAASPVPRPVILAPRWHTHGPLSIQTAVLWEERRGKPGAFYIAGNLCFD